MEFPNILVINLDDRPERWDGIQKSFDGWPSLERVSAVKASPGWKGCAKSHIKCIKIAKERGYPWVLILEDDCEVKADSLERFRELLPYLWEMKSAWDIFLGGCTNAHAIKLITRSPPILQMTGLCAHFYICNSTVYDTIIEQYKPSNEANIVEIDLYYKNTLRLFSTTPHLAIQKPGKSDNEEEDVNYTPHFTNAEAKLNKFLASQKAVEGFTINHADQRIAVNFIIASVAFVILFICTNQRRRRVLYSLLVFLIVLGIVLRYVYIHEGFGDTVRAKGFILTLIGGLGNQLFVYAGALSLKNKFGVPVYLLQDAASAKKHSKTDYRDYMKDMIAIDDSEEIVRSAKKFTFSDPGPYTDYNVNEIPVGEDVYILFEHLHFQNFRTIVNVIPSIKASLIPLLKAKYGAPTIDGSSTAFIHVRHGDYLTTKHNNIGVAVPNEYYISGLEILNNSDDITTIYVFSDDIEWCKKQSWNTNKDLVYFDDPDELKTLYMMSQCWAGAVISNSTFSLWGTLLGSYEKTDIIVYPTSEYFVKNLPTSWIKI